MKITNLGYNPINQTCQNCKSKQQNSPAFKGSISIIGNRYKVLNFDSIVSGVANEIVTQTHQNLGYTSEIIKNKGSMVSIIPFISDFDHKGKQLAANLNAESLLKGIPVNFVFTSSPRLN